MVLYVDGGCSANDQKDMAKRVMVAVVTDDAGTLLSEQTAPGGSNNIAELQAVHDALAWCQRTGVGDVEIRTDSRNNLSWVFGQKVGKQINDREKVLALKARITILRQTVMLRLIWVPREDNLAGHYIESFYAL